MPFYIRSAPRRPLWIPALWGGGAMLIWAIGQAFLTGSRGSHPQLGGLGRGLYVIGLGALAGGVAGLLSWAYGTAAFRKLPLLRHGSAAVAVALFLAFLTLAAGLAKPEGPWYRLGRTNFWLSTILVSPILGWFVARDPFDMAKSRERVYLTPAEFAALTPFQQSLLSLDSASPERPNPTGTG